MNESLRAAAAHFDDFFFCKVPQDSPLGYFFGGGMNLCEHYRVRYGQPLDKVNPVVSITE